MYIIPSDLPTTLWVKARQASPPPFKDEEIGGSGPLSDLPRRLNYRARTSIQAFWLSTQAFSNTTSLASFPSTWHYFISSKLPFWSAWYFQQTQWHIENCTDSQLLTSSSSDLLACLLEGQKSQPEIENKWVYTWSRNVYKPNI